jgi:ABC-2 type transport system ATP-binding protein
MIRTDKLTRLYNKRIAVNSLCLATYPGEVFGLLGPNGAGKTTTVRMLTTLLKPSSGTATIDNCNIITHPHLVKNKIGYSPQEINLDRDLTGYQNLYIHGLMHGMRKPDKRCQELIDWAGISNHAKDPVRTYSGGMQRRIQIARAIMHDPSMLFLDEPTVGLDPQIRRTLWDLIKKLKNKNIGVLLTTHYIEEAEMLCDRVGIMNKGELIACDTPANLKQLIGAFVVESQDNGSVVYRLFSDKNEAHQFAQNQERKIIRIRESTLEDVFIHFAGEKFDL